MNNVGQFLCCLALALMYYAFPALAGDLSKGEIICALDPKCAKPPLTRSFGRGRGVSVQGEEPPPPPLSVDLYVTFAYNSADLTSDARITLDQLGAALGDERLQNFTFLIAGHTDAKGTVQYNQVLSERRAAAVRQYLVSQYGIQPARLSSKGYGKSNLLDPSRPEDGVNRRVQVVNLSVTN